MSLLQWLRSLALSRPVSAPRRRPSPPRLERLEDRLAPAFNLTVSAALTVGVSSSFSGGTTTFHATATGANLSTADVVTALMAGNVVIDSRHRRDRGRQHHHQ
jgi:hypothetical protein